MRLRTCHLRRLPVGAKTYHGILTGDGRVGIAVAALGLEVSAGNEVDALDLLAEMVYSSYDGDPYELDVTTAWHGGSRVTLMVTPRTASARWWLAARERDAARFIDAT